VWGARVRVWLASYHIDRLANLPASEIEGKKDIGPQKIRNLEQILGNIQQLSFSTGGSSLCPPPMKVILASETPASPLTLPT
jgi:hypothetical protein